VHPPNDQSSRCRVVFLALFFTSQPRIQKTQAHMKYLQVVPHDLILPGDESFARNRGHKSKRCQERRYYCSTTIRSTIRIDLFRILRQRRRSSRRRRIVCPISKRVPLPTTVHSYPLCVARPAFTRCASVGKHTSKTILLPKL
jgi:hypothetical protein